MELYLGSLIGVTFTETFLFFIYLGNIAELGWKKVDRGFYGRRGLGMSGWIVR